MLYLEHRISIKASRPEVFHWANTPELYPQFAPAYRESRVLSRGEEELVVERVAEDRGKLRRWTSRCQFLENEWIEFEQLSGPLKGMRAIWKFVPTGAGTEVTIVHQFKHPCPVLGWLIEWIATKRVGGITTTLLGGLKKHLENLQTVGK